MPVEPEAFVSALQDTVDRLPETVEKRHVEQYQKELLEIFSCDEVAACMGVSVFTKAARQAEYSEFTRRLMRKSADIARARIPSVEEKVRVSLRAESNENLALRDIEAAILRIADHNNCEDEDVELLFKTYLNLLGDDNGNENNGDDSYKNELDHSYSADDMRALVDMLCFGDIIIAFIKTVFKQPKTEVRRTCLCMLIAIAEEFITRPTASNHLKHKEVRTQCRLRIVDKYKKLDSATKICGQLPPDSWAAKFGKEKRAEQLVNAIETGGGTIALGVVEWVKYGIAGSEGYTLGKSLVKYLAFIEAVAYNNQKLRPKCVSVVHVAFMKTTQEVFEDVDIDIRDTCRDKCVETYAVLAGLYCAESIMHNMERYYLPNRSIDNSHIRKMVRAVVDNFNVDKPFNPEFLRYVRGFLMLDRVRQSLSACDESKRVVHNFLQQTDGRPRYAASGYRRTGARYM